MIGNIWDIDLPTICATGIPVKFSISLLANKYLKSFIWPWASRWVERWLTVLLVLSKILFKNAWVSSKWLFWVSNCWFRTFRFWLCCLSRVVSMEVVRTPFSISTAVVLNQNVLPLNLKSFSNLRGFLSLRTATNSSKIPFLKLSGIKSDILP